jgi:hypothetical protein
VRGTGFEPARRKAQPPQGCLSTNFNTRACLFILWAREESNLHETQSHNVLDVTRPPCQSVPETGFEPAIPKREHSSEPCASTNFATLAYVGQARLDSSSSARQVCHFATCPLLTSIIAKLAADWKRTAILVKYWCCPCSSTDRADPF